MKLKRNETKQNKTENEIEVLRPLGAGAAAVGLAFCFTAAVAASSSAEVVEAATVGVGRDRALNDGRENRSNFVFHLVTNQCDHFKLINN